jgi:hypothetical protein
MADRLEILFFGASYGALLAMKAGLAGHHSHLVCQAATAATIKAEGTIVRMPVAGRGDGVTVRSTTLPGRTTASVPADVDLDRFDLVVLAMQEPQYSAPGVRDLLQAVAKAKLPTLSIMNMPPLPYLARIAGVDLDKARAAYAEPALWDVFDPTTLTLCSPDPQAFRPPGEPPNVLQVRLPTNFKSARFARADDTAMLQRLADDIEAARVDGLELPVKLKVHDSVFVPLAKWAMLLAGNYRCVGATEMRPIRDAVHGDLDTARAVYDHVVDLCVRLGADRADLVPFDKYAAAAKSLAAPSSAARALAAGAIAIERVDKLVQMVGHGLGRPSAAIDATVATIDGWLTRNRAAG